MFDPILAATTDSKKTAAILGERVPMVARAVGGLRRLGKQAPYFTITLDAHRAGFPNQREHGGAAHDTIRALFGDKFDDLIALHLSDENGVPMHAVANGAYWLHGYFGGNGKPHHGGNHQMHFPKKPEDIDPAKPWATTDYREPTRAECLDVFAKLWRITTDEAREIARDCMAHGLGRFTARLEDHAGTMKARWQAQAKDAITKHSLGEF